MADKTRIKFWEYFWYAFVTMALAVVGFLLLVFSGLLLLARALKPNRLSWGYIVSTGMAIILLCSGYIYYRYVHKVDLGTAAVVITVKQGDSFSSIVDQLYNQKVIDTRLLVKIRARWLKIDTRLIPGDYRFIGKNSAQSVLDRLAKGEGAQVRLTIVEGLPLWKVASQMKYQLGLDSAAIIALGNDTGFLNSLGIPYLEGYLFPETYLFAPGTQAKSVVETMVKMFHARTNGIWADTILSGLSKTKALILASIVQAEARLETEEPQIASVYLNRLKLGMNLDADPTVIYGLGGLDRLLTRNDLEKPSPYNTYLNVGLPPTPINSPGMAAMQAALHAATTDYLYFVADGTGGHIFSKTNEQHNEARRRAKIMQRTNPRQ
jgi:UPF0755 protein